MISACGKIIVDAQSVIRRRNEYGKMVRKEYENGNPNNIRMKDIRDWTTREDGIASTITTVELDRIIMELLTDDDFSICCAMRGRYDDNGKINQQLEVNSTEYANAITTVQKDCMILEINNTN